MKTRRGQRIAEAWESINAMKQKTDQHRLESTFEGDREFLSPQPYKQASLKMKGGQKLAPRFYGSYKIIKRIGELAYQLGLLLTPKMHPMLQIKEKRLCMH